MVWKKAKNSTIEDFIYAGFVCSLFSLPFGTSPPIIFASLAVLLWLFSGKFFTLRHYYIGKKWFWPILALILLPWIGLTYSSDVSGLGIKFAKKTHYWIYCLSLASVCYQRRSFQYLIVAFIAGLTVNAFIGLFQFMGILSPVDGWYLGLSSGYSALSVFLVIGVLMTSFYFREENKSLNRFVLGLLMGLLFFHLIILEGRAAYLSLILLSPMIIRNLFHGIGMTKGLITIVVLLGLMALSPVVRDRVAKSIEQIQYHINAPSDSAWGKKYSDQQDRFYMWNHAVKIFIKNPFLGIGTGDYQTEMVKTGDPDAPLIAHPHNNILYMAVSFGIIGIAVLFWFFWEITANAWRERNTELGYFLLIISLAIFVSGLVNTQILDANTAFFLAIAAGLQQGLKRFSNETP